MQSMHTIIFSISVCICSGGFLLIFSIINSPSNIYIAALGWARGRCAVAGYLFGCEITPASVRPVGMKLGLRVRVVGWWCSSVYGPGSALTDVLLTPSNWVACILYIYIYPQSLFNQSQVSLFSHLH